jgi:hypothetical protein
LQNPDRFEAAYLRHEHVDDRQVESGGAEGLEITGIATGNDNPETALPESRGQCKTPGRVAVDDEYAPHERRPGDGPGDVWRAAPALPLHDGLPERDRKNPTLDRPRHRATRGDCGIRANLTV